MSQTEASRLVGSIRWTGTGRLPLQLTHHLVAMMVLCAEVSKTVLPFIPIILQHYSSLFYHLHKKILISSQVYLCLDGYIDVLLTSQHAQANLGYAVTHATDLMLPTIRATNFR